LNGKRILTVIFLVISAISVYSQDFQDIYALNLNKDNGLRSKELDYLEAQKTYQYTSGIFTPELKLGISPLKIGKDGIVKMNPSSSDLSFEITGNILNLYGSKVGFSVPVNITFDGFKTDFSGIDISLSRNIKLEYSYSVYSANANYMNKMQAFESYRKEAFEKTYDDIFSYYYTTETLKNLGIQKEMLNNQIKNEKDPDIIKDLKNQLETLELNIESQQMTLKKLDYFEYSDQLLTYVEDFTKALKEKYSQLSSVESRYDVLAVLANDKALSKKINNWFLPYIPDINLSLACDITDITNWNLGISFSADIFSGGQNFFEAERRKITNLTYSEYVKNINDKIKNYELQIKTKENSIKTIESDLRELQNELKNQEKLLKIGYISNQDLENQKIKISSKTLELKKSEKELNILWLDYIFEKGFYY